MISLGVILQRSGRASQPDSKRLKSNNAGDVAVFYELFPEEAPKAVPSSVTVGPTPDPTARSLPQSATTVKAERPQHAPHASQQQDSPVLALGPARSGKPMSLADIIGRANLQLTAEQQVMPAQLAQLTKAVGDFHTLQELAQAADASLNSVLKTDAHEVITSLACSCARASLALRAYFSDSSVAFCHSVPCFCAYCSKHSPTLT